MAVSKKLTSVVESLCQRGASLDAHDSSNEPAVWQAVSTGAYQVADVLVSLLLLCLVFCHGLFIFYLFIYFYLYCCEKNSRLALLACNLALIDLSLLETIFCSEISYVWHILRKKELATSTVSQCRPHNGQVKLVTSEYFTQYVPENSL